MFSHCKGDPKKKNVAERGNKRSKFDFILKTHSNTTLFLLFWEASKSFT